MHEINERDVQVGHEMAWHNLTKIVPVDEPIGLANCQICYPMEKQPTFLKQPDGSFKQDGEFRIVSMDDNLPIGSSVGKNYVIIDNCNRIEGALEVCAKHGGSIESCGTVRNREIGFCSIQVESAVNIADQPTQVYLNRVWGHGGTKGLVDKLSITKQVCANTIQLSLSEGSDFVYTARHTKGSIKQMGDLSKTFDAYHKMVQAYKETIETFASTPITLDKARRVFAGFVCPEKGITEVSTRASNIIDELVLSFQKGKGNNGKTLEDVYSAFTDYYTHQHAGGRESLWKQFESSEFGSGLDRKVNALKLLRGDKVKGFGTLDEVVAHGKDVLALI
jgi:hypothetical protein